MKLHSASFCCVFSNLHRLPLWHILGMGNKSDWQNNAHKQQRVCCSPLSLLRIFTGGLTCNGLWRQTSNKSSRDGLYGSSHILAKHRCLALWIFGFHSTVHPSYFFELRSSFFILYRASFRLVAPILGDSQPHFGRLLARHEPALISHRGFVCAERMLEIGEVHSSRRQIGIEGLSIFPFSTLLFALRGFNHADRNLKWLGLGSHRGRCKNVPFRTRALDSEGKPVRVAGYSEEDNAICAPFAHSLTKIIQSCTRDKIRELMREWTCRDWLLFLGQV